MLVKGELVTIERSVGVGQKDKIIEEKADEFLLRFRFLEKSTVEKLSRTDRVCQGVESYLLLQGFLLRLEVNMYLEPLQPLRVLLHPHPLIDLVTEDPRPTERLLCVEVVRMVGWSVGQDLLHQERILRHPLDRFEKVE